MRPLISIIVPVFNVENFLDRCLSSLTSQTLKDIEIVVVNDGSTDSSREIARAHAEQDDRIRVIDQSNQGLSGARNTGIGEAKGEYLAFVDSDDWVDPEMFAAMYAEAVRTHADICACDYTLAYERDSVSNVLKLEAERIDIEVYGLDRLWNSKKYAVVVWNKIYRRSLVEEYRLRFESNRRVFSEDVLFNLCFLRHASVFASVPGAFYHYFQRPDSLTSSWKPDYLKRELYLVDRFADFYADYDNREVYLRILNRLFFERVQNSCVHDVEFRISLNEARSGLLQASLHPGFHDQMRTASRDPEVWRPMRLFANLCARRRYTSAIFLLRTLSGVSRTLRKVRSAGRFKKAASVQVSFF
ncbi:glycosyltransferase [Saccharibacillus deserti]|uniref:glycosyltransferase n=1 Tax=Saccharibacillus deserti TaxID=1634444 RepID=UPI0015578B73